MSERRVLDDKDFDRLSKMINGSDSDYKLVLQIVNACDIRESFKHILCIVPKRWENKYTMGSKVMMQPEVYRYVCDLMGGLDKLPVKCTLEFMMELWAIHAERNKLPSSARAVKDICINFEPNEILETKVRGATLQQQQMTQKAQMARAKAQQK